MAPVVYLSYAAQDAAIATRLRADLGAHNVYVWAPPELLSPGTEAWAAAIGAAIRAAQAVICMVSPDAHASPYVKVELAVAEIHSVPVIYLWVSGDAWAPVGTATASGGQPYIDGRGSRYETGLKELVGAVSALTASESAFAASAPAPAARAWPEADEAAPEEGHASEERLRGIVSSPIDVEPEPLPPPQPAPMPRPAPAPSAPIPARAPSAPAPVRQDEQAVGQPGGYGAPTGGSSPIQEQATFTAYCPKELAPREWRPLLVYISADTAAALAAVNADAAERLGARKDQFRPTTPSGPTQLRRATRLTIVPRLPGFTFNPATLTVSWEEDVQRHEFRLSATSATPGQASNGTITVLEGPFLRAEIPISVFVQHGQARMGTPEGFTSALARVYRRIFASYSRKDSAIVRLCEAAARAIGDRYLMDLNILRSGDLWDDRLLNAIAEADVFQLFWSETAARSPNVEREWRYALQLAPARPNFIRPVYWTPKPYAIPAELSAFHFDHLDPAQVGLKRARFSLAALFGRA